MSSPLRSDQSKLTCLNTSDRNSALLPVIDWCCGAGLGSNPKVR